MTPFGQRFLLISLTLGAFVMGTTTGSVLTFGPGPVEQADAEHSRLSPAAAPSEGLEVEPTKVILAARQDAPVHDRPSIATPDLVTDKARIQTSLGRAGFALTDGWPSIDAAINASDQVPASTRTDPTFPAALPDSPSMTPKDPSLSSDTEMANIARVAKAALTPRPSESKAVEVRQGDSLTTILKRTGIEGRQVHAALRSLRGIYDPRGLRAGQQLTVTAATRDNRPADLLSVTFDLDFDHQLLITRDADGSFTTKKVEQVKRRELVHREGAIKTSLYLSTRREAVPNSVTDRLIRLFSWDVDFQRDIRRGDRFETLYEKVTLEKDENQVKGELVYAGLTLRGELLDAYLYTPDAGRATYYDREGRSLRKFLLRTPIDGARLSSGFGMRKHPILGYSRMHKGTDFAAPRGTPIYAGGSGKIELAGRKGGYGNYVRIRHSKTFSTAYAHLNKFAKGIKAGARIRQGQVIGYVGTTGRSTGPHLHYEVLKNGKQINPMKMKHPPATQLVGAELAAFEKEVAKIDAKRTELARQQRLVSQAADRPGR
ncbi:MAG: peptidoglycan DD-metalloendopeptidase family protein [Geminicoccaceae bacterium]